MTLQCKIRSLGFWPSNLSFPRGMHYHIKEERQMVLDDSCGPYRDKIDFAIRVFSPLAPGIKDIPCQVGVAGEDETDSRLGELNGCLIPPESSDLPFIILIAERQFKDSQYIHTLIHELMHLIDYYQFIEDNGNPNAKSPEELKRVYHWEFQCWAEFHAKQVGFWFYCIYRWCECGNELPPDGRLTFENVDWQAKSVEEPLDRFLAGRSSASANNLLWDLVLALVNYYARMSVAEYADINSFPDPAFPREKLVKALGEHALELFPLLKRMRAYTEAVPLLPSLSALFDKIVTKLNEDSPFSVLRSIQFDQFQAIQEQMRKLVESMTQSLPMTDTFKSIMLSLSAPNIPESITRYISMKDPFKSITQSLSMADAIRGQMAEALMLSGEVQQIIEAARSALDTRQKDK